MSRAHDLLAGALGGALAVVAVRWWRARPPGGETLAPAAPPLPDQLTPPPVAPPLPATPTAPPGRLLPLPGQPRRPTLRWGVQPEGVRAGWVSAAGLALLLLLAATLIGMWGLSALYGPAWRSVDTPVPRRVPAPARASLEPPDPAAPGEPYWEDPAGELRAWRARQEERLHAYRWVDREAGLVAIPIERAIALRAARAGQDRAPEGR